ncbi:metal-sensitive transcriptional regulator [Aurantiacibacter atlanticus]
MLSAQPHVSIEPFIVVPVIHNSIYLYHAGVWYTIRSFATVLSRVQSPFNHREMLVIDSQDGKFKRVITRMRRIEGQARGIAKMLEEERYCVDCPPSAPMAQI